MQVEVGRVEGGFAEWEESINWTRVIRFLEGSIVLFRLMGLISKFLVKLN